MANDTSRILSVFIMMAFLLTSMVIASPPTGAIEENITPPTRGELLEVNDTMVITSSRSLGDVKIRSGGSLIIQGAISVVMETLECKNINDTSFQMIGDGPEEQNRARLTVTGAKLNLQPANIFLQNAVIFAENRVDSIDLNDRGMDVIFNSMSSDFIINNTDIEIWAQNGEDGKSTGGAPIEGTPGADSTLTIQAIGTNDLTITGSVIEVHGGSGGDGKILNNPPGPGGDADLNLMGEFAVIRDSNILSLGGQSGSIVSGTNPGTYGEAGGKAFLRPTSQREMNIERSHIEAAGGIRTDGRKEVTSFIYPKSEDDAIYIDSEKTGTDKKTSLSSLLSDATLIEAPNGAFLHQVDLGDEKPSSQGDTIIFVYWWFEVNVKDNYGNPLHGAVISYTVDNNPTVITSPDNSWITSENGKLNLEVESLVIEPGNPANSKSYTFFAVITGGATGNSDNIEIDNQNMAAHVDITLITVDLKKVMGDEYRPEMVVGGSDAELEGISNPAPNSGNDILSIQWYIGDDLMGDVTDISDPISPPFSRWRVVWNTEGYAEGEIYTVSFVAVDEAYEVRTEAYLKVSQLVINHRPILDRAVIKDTVGEVSATPGESVETHVTRESPYIYLNGTVFDPDARSPYIDAGKVITKVRMVMTRSDGYVVYSKELLNSLGDLIKVNETGGWAYRFKIDTNVKAEVDGQSEYIFSQGEYKIQFHVEDDVPLASIMEESFFMLRLEKDFFPVIKLLMEPRGDKESAAPSDSDHEFDFPVFVAWTKESHTRTITFNLTDSYDTDDPDHDLHDSWMSLTFTVYIGSKSNKVVDSREGISGFDHEFDVKDVTKNKYQSFIVIIEVEDSQGLVSTKTFVVKVTHDPPVPEISIWEEIFGVPPSVKFEGAIFAFPAVFALIIVLYLGLILLSSLRLSREKKKKMALLIKLRDEEKEKGSDIVEDELLMGRGAIKSSGDYLKATGATKGKEDFQKELESKAVKGEGGPAKAGVKAQPAAVPKPAPVPQAPAKAPVPAPVPPPKPAAPPAAPAAQPKPPVAPPQPAVPKPPAPPQG